MLRRPRDYLASLAGADRASCDELLDALCAEAGAPDVLRRPVATRLKREHFQLKRALD